ncbi:MAG: hypothetical protein IIY77_07560 [Lachnospiraceae bacterium]|nr:hypothetical protein [Lachnospiraceae bacterium]
MKADDILEAMENLDDTLLSHTEDMILQRQTVPAGNKALHTVGEPRHSGNRKKDLWSVLGIAAAFLLLAAAIRFLPKNHGQENTTTSPGGAQMAAGSEWIILDVFPGVYYYPAGVDALSLYHFPYSTDGTGGIRFEVTKDDLGEALGKVKDADDKQAVGLSVYQCSKTPGRKNFCVLDQNGSLKLYHAYGYISHLTDGGTLEETFRTYGFPDSCKAMSIWEEREENILYQIEDKETQKKVFELLLSGVNIGLGEVNRRMVNLWKETYGNDQIQFDEASQTIKFYPGTEAEEIIHNGTDSDDTGAWEEFNWPEMNELEEAAYALWDKDSKNLLLENADGFRLSMIIYPQVNCVSTLDGGLDIPAEKMAELIRLLEKP